MANKNINACFSRKTDDWKTPTELYNAFMARGFVDCFPYMADYDELTRSYKNQKLFINPPFSKLRAVVPWVIKQLTYNDVYLLIPARTDTIYFHELMNTGKFHVFFIKGRLHFNDSKAAPFPCILLVSHVRYHYACLPLYFCLDYQQLISYVKGH